jgi:hypothetical protein
MGLFLLLGLVPLLLSVLLAVLAGGSPGFTLAGWLGQGQGQVCRGEAGRGGMRRCTVPRSGVVLITHYDGYMHEAALGLTRMVSLRYDNMIGYYIYSCDLWPPSINDIQAWSNAS